MDPEAQTILSCIICINYKNICRKRSIQNWARENGFLYDFPKSTKNNRVKKND